MKKPSKFPDYNSERDGNVFDWIVTQSKATRAKRKIDQRAGATQPCIVPTRGPSLQTPEPLRSEPPSEQHLVQSGYRDGYRVRVHRLRADENSPQSTSVA